MSEICLEGILPINQMYKPLLNSPIGPLPVNLFFFFFFFFFY